MLLLLGQPSLANPDAEQALAHIQADDLPPDARAEAIRLAAAETGAGQTQALISILDPGGTHTSRRIGSRIAALKALNLRRDPAAAPALAQLFIRSRLGSLPEDPDLFERALRALLQYSPQTIEAALIEGMLPSIQEAAHSQLMERWIAPVGGLDVQTQLEAWSPQDDAALKRELEPIIRDAFSTHGPAWVEAFSTQGGSAWTPLVDRIQARILAGWITDSHPERVRLAAEISLGIGQGWPELHTAIDLALKVAPEQDDWSAAREALMRAQAGLPAKVAWPSLGPPLTAPGHTPGQEYTPPDSPSPPTLLRPGPHSPLRQHGWLLGLALGLCILAPWIATRNPGPRTNKVAAIGFGMGALLLLEGFLRLLTPGGDAPPLFQLNGFDAAPLEARQRDGETWLETPGGSMRHQVIAPTPEGHRVVVLGASSVHGSHYLAEETFSARLEQQLRDGEDGIAVEVLNMGIGGTLSDGIRATGIQALEHGADLLIVYYGHNEVGQFVQLGQFSAVDPDAIATRIALSRTATGRLMQKLLRPTEDGSLSGAGEAIVSGQPSSRADIERLKALAVHNFRWNLSLLLDAAGRRGVPVILCQVATNFRFSHLNPINEAGPGDALDLERRVQQAESLAKQGKAQEAQDAWQGAIDVSASPREVSSHIRRATEELAESHGATLVDIQSHFYQGSPDGLSVSGLFWDDLHPTVKGHGLIAEALTEPVQALLKPD